MKTVCESRKCTGCSACSAVCPTKAITMKETFEYCWAEIDEQKCIRCGKCERVCQVHNSTQLQNPVLWHQGWAKEEAVRVEGSSGGVASALAEGFIALGGEVCTCAFKEGEFAFIFASNRETLKETKGSKYVKTNPRLAYAEIKNKLTSGKQILFIGLPCQVAAVKNYVGNLLAKNLYTIDLICHGTPTQETLAVFLKQYGYDIASLKDISFRRKDAFGIHTGFKSLSQFGVRDPYTIAFLNAVNYTENCYSCQFAQIKRSSDITLGDSWESDLADDEKKKGVSLILTQTEKGKELLDATDLCLLDVELDKAVRANHQLNHPSLKPTEREKYLQLLKDGKSFNATVFRCYPKQYVKQRIKSLMIKLKIIRGG